jgi:hypothetical protein
LVDLLCGAGALAADIWEALLMYPMLVDGKLMVPRRAESPDGTTIGDTWVELSPEDPEHPKWLEAIERLAKAAGRHSET